VQHVAIASRSATQTLGRLRLGLQVARQRARLDAALAEGAEAVADPALALRAHQLTRESTRRAIANTLINLLDAAEEPPATWAPSGPRPPIQRHAILAGRDEIVTLAHRLREPVDVSPQAAALAALLVWDPASPLYTDQQDATVAGWAYRILELTGSEDLPSPSRV
jgi:hypothetical protein